MKKLLLLISIFVIVCSSECSNDNQATKSIMIVQGNLKGLPDGTIFLVGRTIEGNNLNIDSTFVKNGQFHFAINKERLPHFLTLEHISLTGVKMSFSFETNKKFKGGELKLEYFMPDDTILLDGELKDFAPKDFQLPPDIRLVYPAQPIKAGKQTYVLYNVAIDFNQKNADSLINGISNLIRKYDYSYYLLSEIYDHRSDFTSDQIKSLLSLFNKEVQHSDIAISLIESLKYKNNKEISNVSFLNKEFRETKLSTDKPVTMVILWASWCQPCREEIPELKKIYREFSDNSNFQMVSISLDKNKEDWQKALALEKILWQQLLLPPEFNKYSNEIFKFDGLIPTTIFLNNSGKEITRVTGYDKSSDESYEKIISENLKH